MKHIAIIVFFTMMIACKPHASPEQSDKFKVTNNRGFMEDALTIKTFREFDEGFDIKHYMFLRGALRKTAIISAKALLHGRYILVMRLPVKDAGDGRMIQASADIEWFIYEVDHVKGRNIRYTQNQRQLSLSDWNALVSSGMDFSVIGYEMKTDKPIHGLEQLLPAG